MFSSEDLPKLWESLRSATHSAKAFSDLFSLSTRRKRALKDHGPKNANAPVIRTAVLGSYSLQIFSEIYEHVLQVEGFGTKIYQADFGQIETEILNPESRLYAFEPQILILVPSSIRVDKDNDAILGLCETFHTRTGGDVILCNFIPEPYHDAGAIKSKLQESDWNKKRALNLDLGLRAPSYVQICDLEFLAYRMGAAQTWDERGWYESKQFGSGDFIAAAAKEAASIAIGLRRGSKKVLVTDLDNTLWGGVIGDDGLEGIELGGHSPRGEAFQRFQEELLALKKRGVLLAVCSKNDHAKATEPFEKHPEMVLRLGDIVSFQANWLPKSDNIHQIAQQLGLGLDSFVFVDDNPAEIEIVRQFLPQVETIHLGDDPAEFAQKLKDSRHFEPTAITEEDLVRTGMYQAENSRRALLSSVTDVGQYLQSLQMVAKVSPFTAIDLPRIAQLVNKSNQFNLTTRRRTVSELEALMGDPAYRCFTIRLSDRFGDHGLVVVGICENVKTKGELRVDTWLMSCRVLGRQVEEFTMNEIFRAAGQFGAKEIVGEYIPTAKNEMVAEIYPKLSFAMAPGAESSRFFRRDTGSFREYGTHIERKDS